MGFGCVLCVGMNVLDIIHKCEEYPTEDTDRRSKESRLQRGGNASNNCTVLRILGAKCDFLGMLSSKITAHGMLEDFSTRGIGISNCPFSNQEPPHSSIILSEATGSRTIIHSNNNFPILEYEHFRKVKLNDYTWIHFEARNSEETEKMMLDIINHNKHVPPHHNITISLEIEKCNRLLFSLAQFADYVFIGKELATHMGWKNKHEAVYKVRSMCSAKIICTWGTEGCALIENMENYVEYAAVPVPKIVDSLGAGDTFCAATIFALNNLEIDLKKAVKFGNSIAAYKVQHEGYDDVAGFYLNSYSMYVDSV